MIAPREPTRDAEARRFPAQLLDALEQAVIATDLAGTICSWNRAAERLYGWTAAEALGRPILDVTPSTLSRQQAADILARLQAGERWAGEFLVQRRDGSAFPAWVIDAPIHDAAGTLIGIVGISSDYRETKRAQAALAATAAARDQALEEVQTALRVRNEFLASVSHDLLGPLTAIQGFADLAMRQVQRATSTPARLVAQLGQITATATQMTDQIQELLDLARLDTGEALPLQRTPTDLVALTRAVVEQYRATTEANGVVFAPAVPGLVGDWDAPRLRRVLDNVVNNAIKYSQVGAAVTLQVDQVEQDGQHWALLTVHDQGRGIPAADLPRLFQRFQRGGNVRGIGGTGLGLAGAQQIVDQHGGTIAIQSQEGVGTTVTIRLPLVRDVPQAHDRTSCGSAPAPP